MREKACGADGRRYARVKENPGECDEEAKARPLSSPAELREELPRRSSAWDIKHRRPRRQQQADSKRRLDGRARMIDDATIKMRNRSLIETWAQHGSGIIDSTNQDRENEGL